MTKEVMKQALEALEDIFGKNKVDVGAINALRQAIAEEEKQNQGEQLARLGWQEIDCPICGGGAQAFPKQEQGEPVAWVDLLKNAEQIIKNKFLYKRFIDGTPLANDIPCWMADFAQKYTTPQTKKWVGLTTEEQSEIYNINYNKYAVHLDFADFLMIYTAIEAKLKEKNT